MPSMPWVTTSSGKYCLISWWSTLYCSCSTWKCYIQVAKQFKRLGAEVGGVPCVYFAVKRQLQRALLPLLHRNHHFAAGAKYFQTLSSSSACISASYSGVRRCDTSCRNGYYHGSHVSNPSLKSWIPRVQWRVDLQECRHGLGRLGHSHIRHVRRMCRKAQQLQNN